MDKHYLNITALGKTDILDRLRALPPVSRLTVNFVDGEIDKPETYKDADYIILHKHFDKKDFLAVKDEAPLYAKFILYVDLDTFDALDNANLKRYFNIWVKSERILNYRLSKFLEQARTNLDNELAVNQLDTLIDALPDLIWYKDVRGAHIKVNNAFCRTVNKTKALIKDRGHCYIWNLDPAEYEQGEYVCMETEDIVIEQQKTFLFDEKVKIGDEMRQLKTYKSAIVGRDGKTLGTVGFARDVTDIWNTHEEFRTLIGALPLPILLVHTDYEYVSTNGAFESMIRLADPAFLRMNKEDFNMVEFGYKYFKKDFRNDGVDELSTQELTLETERGARVYIVEKSPIMDVFSQLTGFFYCFRDVTDSRQYEAKLQHAAEIDELTQMNNRKIIKKFFSCDEEFPNQLDNNLAVIMLDIDYFKKYNDHYGHLAGDEVIKTLADILKSYDNGEDLLACRFGGEEFTVISKDRPFNEVEQLIKNIISDLAKANIEHIRSDVAKIVTISVGGIFYPQLAKTSDIKKVIAAADLYLYEAKNSGRNKYVLSYANENDEI